MNIILQSGFVVVTRSQNARWPVIQTIEQTPAAVDSFTMREPSVEDVLGPYNGGVQIRIER